MYFRQLREANTGSRETVLLTHPKVHFEWQSCWLPTYTDICLKHTCSQRDGVKHPNGLYLVGVCRKESQSCSNAALGGQKVGILTHLLSQKRPHSIRVHSLGELHGFAQDYNFLY